MEGKIAVGNVVLNRVNDPRFPNTVYGVVFQRNQFTPAMTGTINRTPNESSVIAAKLCLEGANTAGAVSYTHLDVYKRQPHKQAGPENGW